MDVNYKFTNEAELELYRAICYFKLYKKDELFLDDLLEQLRAVYAMPVAFQIKYRQVRIVSLEKYSYSIHYTIYEDSIIILRILNQKQDF
ncbi:MAG: type II toxin-antitoxin system RelE/ParE family toxin [Algibacter sp.]